MNSVQTTQAQTAAASSSLEQLQVLGFTDELDYQQHQKVMQASQELAAQQLATMVTVGESPSSEAFVINADLNDRYADVIIGDRAEAYDAIEIQGVRNLNEEGDPMGTSIEVDTENPQFYSVYVRIKSGEAECVGDMGTHALAQAYANELHVKHGWPVNDFTLKRQHQALNMIVKVRLGFQSAYACIKTDTTNLDVRLSPGKSAKASLGETVKEMREKAESILKRADLIEAAAQQL